MAAKAVNRQQLHRTGTRVHGNTRDWPDRCGLARQIAFVMSRMTYTVSSNPNAGALTDMAAPLRLCRMLTHKGVAHASSDRPSRDRARRFHTCGVPSAYGRSMSGRSDPRNPWEFVDVYELGALDCEIPVEWQYSLTDNRERLEYCPLCEARAEGTRQQVK